MAESNFSLSKIASFIGACLLLVLAFVCVASGLNMIKADSVFYGVASILGGVSCLAWSAFIYKNYQDKH